MDKNFEKDQKIKQALTRLCQENLLTERDVLEITKNISDIRVRAQLLTKDEIEQLKSSLGEEKLNEIMKIAKASL